MYSIVDILSSEYGWTFEYILDYIHLGDLFGFLNSIERRKKSEALLSLAITHNPYSKDPDALFKELRGNSPEGLESSIDRASLSSLKKELKQKSKFVKIKNG